MFVGTILRQRYKIIEQLGGGGFGETYLAEDLINIPVTPKPKRVVKRLKPQKRDNPDMVRRFKKEAATLYELGSSHDQIPKLYDYFEENRDFYLIQELIDGHDLSKEIRPSNPWSEDEVIQLLQEILEVLAFVHKQGVIHRDIKPSNIMRRYSDGKLVIIDFGTVREVSTQMVNSEGQMSSTTSIGTLGYMPSEQINGHPRLSSDIYAMGMIAIQALTGVLPQQLPKDPNTLEIIWRDRAQVSKALADVLDQMVRYHFSQRYSSTSEVLQALALAAVVPPPSPVTPLEPIYIGGKYGYQDRTRRVVIYPKFDRAYSFDQGLAQVKVGNKWGCIDQTGQIVIQPQFDWIEQFDKGLAKIKVGGKYGYINRSGQVVVQPQFDEIDSFSEGLARIKDKGKYGYINQSGQVVIQPQFDWALNFFKGLGKVRINHKYGYINQTGQIVIQPRFDMIVGFSEGLAHVKVVDKWGYIDQTGQIVIQPQFDSAGSFVNRRAWIRIGKKYGYINQTGQIVIQPQFDEARSFSEEWAEVKVDGQWRYIDQTGKFISPHTPSTEL